jgi:hypothetical protein
MIETLEKRESIFMKTRFLQIESQKIISHAASRISFYQND